MVGSRIQRGTILAADILPLRQSPERHSARKYGALDALVGRINVDPAQALQALVETVVQLTDTGAAGVSILAGSHFIWPAIAGCWAKYAGERMPLESSPCRFVIESNQSLLFDQPLRLFPDAGGEPSIEELLLMPLSAGRAPSEHREFSRIKLSV